MGFDEGLKEREAGERRAGERLETGTGQAIGALTDAQKQAIGALQTGTSQAISGYQPYAQTGQEALGALKGYSGLPGGTQIGLQESPLYQFRKKQLEQSLAQRLSAQGMGRSLAATSAVYAPALQQLTAEETEKNYGRLASLLNLGYDATGRISSLQSGLGSDISGLTTGYAGNIANLRTGLGANLAGIERNIGEARAQGAEAPYKLLGTLAGTGMGLGAYATGKPLGAFDYLTGKEKLF